MARMRAPTPVRANEAYSCQKRPIDDKRDLFMSKRPVSVQRDLLETFLCQKRPVDNKRDLFMSNRPVSVQRDLLGPTALHENAHA